MAFLDEQDEEMRLLATRPAAAPVASAAPATAGGAQGTPPARAGPAGTGHVNLDRYLGANATGGAQMADRIAGGIERDANQLQRDTKAFGSDFWDRVIGNVTGSPKDRGPAMQKISTRPAAPYSGPETLEAFDPARATGLRQQASGVAERSRLAGGQGVGTLLANEYGRGGGYSSGMQGFDAFLAGAAGGDRLARTSSRYGALDNMLSPRLTQQQSIPAPAAPAAPPPKAPSTPVPPDVGYGGGLSDEAELRRQRRLDDDYIRRTGGRDQGGVL